MYQLSARELRDLFIQGKQSAKSIVECYLARIEKYDPQIGAFLKVFKEQSLQRAEELDKRRKDGKPLGKLAGIPIAVKDNILVKDEIATCGSKFLTNYTSPYHATGVRLLLDEDAIIIGKTNLDEFGMGSSTENSSLQKTYNPWNLKCVPGGSSGGSAAAVAARLCPLAIGTDTGGSVRLPAAFCNIVGFKPTYGRVSRYGVVAYGSSFDQIGSFATNAKDVALMMEVMGRKCEKDSTSLQEGPEDYLNHFDQPLKGLKIGVPWQFLNELADEPKRIFQNGIENLKKAGSEIVDVDLSILQYSLAVYYILVTAEASTNLARFDGIRYGQRSPKAKTLEEVYDFSKEEGFGPEVKRRIMLGTFVLSAGYQDAYYKKAQKVRTLIIDSYKAAFSKCDLIATPVSPFAAFEMGSIKDPLQMYLEDIYTIGLNLAGLPGVSMPNGFNSQGMPMGIQFIGPQKQDRLVLKAGNAFESLHNYDKLMPELIKESSSHE